ncbi:MAG TPA: hypothetical protein VMX75_05445, partial [Spirochaetia bacterium]|nr:hypothetical protein [Spirochaetia bacterium]
MSKINAPLIVLFLLSSLMLTCSNQEYAIFYFVENEKEQVDNSLDNNLSILSMVKSGSEYFIAAAGSMYTRSEGDDVKEWDHVDFPSGADYCTAMAFFDDGGGGKIYAAFLMDNGSFALFRGNPAKSPGWTEIMDPKVRDRQIIRLEVV